MVAAVWAWGLLVMGKTSIQVIGWLILGNVLAAKRIWSRCEVEVIGTERGGRPKHLGLGNRRQFVERAGG